MKSREIKLLDLAAQILLKWRVIFVWMLLGGILMGIVGYRNSYRTIQEQMALEYTEKEDWWIQLTEQQIDKVNKLIYNENIYILQKTYFDNSIKMHVNALSMPRVELTFRVATDTADDGYRIAQVYEDLFPEGVSQWVAEEEQAEISAAVIRELVEIDRHVQENGDTFSISVCHITEEECMQLAEQIDDYLQEQRSLFVSTLGEHDIQLVNQTFAVIMDPGLMNTQLSTYNQIDDWGKNIADMKAALTDLERRYYETVMEPEEQENIHENKQEEKVAVERPSVNGLYVLIGMFLLGCLSGFYFFIRNIFNKRIQGTDDINDMYGVQSLGVIPAEKESKKILKCVDRWVLKICNTAGPRLAKKEAVGIAAIKVEIAAKKADLNKVYCVGCNIQNEVLETAVAVQDILKGKDITVKIVNNILTDQNAMEQLLDVRGAFLLEKAGETLYNEIADELEYLRRQDIEVIGIILAE